MNRKAISVCILLISLIKQSFAVENLTCVNSSYYNTECGETDIDTGHRIVGGTEARLNAYPWIVAIENNYEIECSGSLIDNIHILTASHCIYDDDWKRFKIYLNLHDWDNKQNATVRRVTKIDLFNKKDKVNGIKKDDIAILTLNKPVTFSSDIVPICLPPVGEDFSGKIVNLAGWGLTEEGYQASKLQETQLRLLPRRLCHALDAMSSLLNDNVICAFAKGRDGCQGDSGGPLMEEIYPGKWQQIGIVSWGIGCANPKFPGVYTAVSKYVPWINNITKNATKCTDERIDFSD